MFCEAFLFVASKRNLRLGKDKKSPMELIFWFGFFYINGTCWMENCQNPSHLSIGTFFTFSPTDPVWLGAWGLLDRTILCLLFFVFLLVRSKINPLTHGKVVENEGSFVGGFDLTSGRYWKDTMTPGSWQD
jgi:hypothetical protein